MGESQGGNATFRFYDTAVLSVAIAEAPIVVTSAEIGVALADTYERLDVRPGLLEGLAGIVERRWWPEDVTFADAAAMAGSKALAEAGIEPGAIGLLVDTSVSRAHLEPSAAVDVHHQLSMPSRCLNFDLSNACLGFVNGMHLAGTLIDAGQIDYAIVVDGEGSRGLHERTIERLQRPEATVSDIFENFASLTLGEAGEQAIGIATHVPHYLGQFDYPPAAIAALEALGRVTDLRIEVQDLRAAASRAEGEIAQQLQGSEEFVTIVRALEQQYDQMAALRAAPASAAGSELAPGGHVPSGEEIAAQVEQFLADMHGRESGDAQEG